ncbi:MAG: PKD domain-containing protein [Cyclobacteriaceae bacterium]
MKYFLTILFILSLLRTHGQEQQGNLHLIGDEMIVLPGTGVHIKGDLKDQSGDLLFNGQAVTGTIINGDTIYVAGDIVNEADNQILIADNGSIILNGDTIQIIEGNPVLFHQLILDKDTSVVPYQYFLVSDSLRFLSGFINLDSAISGVDLGNFGKVYEETNDKRFFGRLGKSIARNRGVSGPTENIAGLGLSLTPDGSLGATTIERQNGYQAGAADGSVNRYYRVIPSNKEQTLDNLVFQYFDAELRGLDEADFSIWESANEGVLWRQYKTILDNPGNTVTGEAIVLGREKNVFTIADSTCAVVPVVQISPRDTIATCEGVPVELDAANPGLFFQWNTGATSQKISVSTPGKYIVRVTDTNGCFGMDTVVVVEKPYPVVGFNQAFTCLGTTSSFTNSSTLSDPEGVLSYFWNFGVLDDLADTADIEDPEYTYESEGAYQVTLTATSDFECATTLSKTYVVHPLPAPAFGTANVCQGLDNVFTNNSTILSNIGAVNYSITNYDWDFGVQDVATDISAEVTPTFDFPEAADYTIRLIATSNAGCIDSVKQDVTVYPLPQVDFTAEEVCVGTDLSIDNLTTIADGTMTYTWDFDDDSGPNTEPSPIKEFTAPGFYDIELTATSDQMCTTSVTKTVEAQAIPEVVYALVDACAGNFISMNNTSSIESDDALTYNWSIEGQGGNTTRQPALIFEEAGDYTYKLVVTSDNGCADSLTREAIVYPVPIADFKVDNECEGEQIRVINKSTISQGELIYKWSIDGQQISTEATPTLADLEAGTYDLTLEVSIEEGCSATITRPLTIYPLPVIDIPAELSTCGDQLILDAGNEGARYLWSDNSSSQELTVTRPGTYSVTVTTPDGCTAFASTTISFDNEFSPNLPESAIGCDSVVLDAGNPGSQSYLWSTGETTRTITIFDSQTLSVEIVDQNGCPGSQAVEVTINQSSELNLAPEFSACNGEEIILDTGLDGLIHEWSTGENTTSITVTTSGVYTVTVTSDEGCSTTASTTVDILDNPIIDLGADGVYCDEVLLQLPPSDGTISWSDGSTGSELLVTASGEYWARIESPNGCMATDTVLVEIVSSPLPALVPLVTACSGEVITLDAQNEGMGYTWSTGDTTRTIDILDSKEVSVLIDAGQGCILEEAVSVVFEPRVEFDLGADQSLCAGADLEVNAPIAEAEYSWATANGVFSNDPTVRLSEAGLYWLEVTTAAGCQGTDSLSISVTQDTVISQFLMVSEAFVGDTVNFKNISVPLEAEDYWSFGDGVQSRVEDPQHIYLREGTYDVNLRVELEACVDDLSKMITVASPESGRVEQGEELNAENPFAEIFIRDTITTANVFPNPFMDVFSLEVEKAKDGPLLVMLYDMSGKLWFTEEFGSLSELARQYNMSNLPSGQYILAIRTRASDVYKQLIKR